MSALQLVQLILIIYTLLQVDIVATLQLATATHVVTLALTIALQAESYHLALMHMLPMLSTYLCEWHTMGSLHTLHFVLERRH